MIAATHQGGQHKESNQGFVGVGKPDEQTGRGDARNTQDHHETGAKTVGEPARGKLGNATCDRKRGDDYTRLGVIEAELTAYHRHERVKHCPGDMVPEMCNYEQGQEAGEVGPQI